MKLPRRGPFGGPREAGRVVTAVTINMVRISIIIFHKSQTKLTNNWVTYENL